MRTDGSELRQLTTHTAHDWVGSWSPDGRHIAFHSLRGGNRDIYVIPVAGGAVTQLTSHPAREITPIWSPDGSQIAFAAKRDGSMNIWIMSSEGGEPRQVTVGGALELPCWSPDSKQLVFGSKHRGKSELFLIFAQGGNPMQLTEGNWLMIFPFIWSADNRMIYAQGLGKPGNEGSNLWAVSVADGTVRLILDLKGSGKEPLALSSDGERLYFTLCERVGDIWMAELSDDSVK